MLILTRRPQERIKIADNVTITILDVRGRQVRLGFIAPREVSIQREEIYLKKIEQERSEKESSRIIRCVREYILP